MMIYLYKEMNYTTVWWMILSAIYFPDFLSRLNALLGEPIMGNTGPVAFLRDLLKFILILMKLNVSIILCLWQSDFNIE